MVGSFHTHGLFNAGNIHMCPTNSNNEECKQSKYNLNRNLSSINNVIFFYLLEKYFKLHSDIVWIDFYSLGLIKLSPPPWGGNKSMLWEIREFQAITLKWNPMYFFKVFIHCKVYEKENDFIFSLFARKPNNDHKFWISEFGTSRVLKKK